MIRVHHFAFVGCLLSSLSACAEPQDQIATPSVAAAQIVSINGQLLTLENNQQRCVLRKPDQSILPLDMPWPCQFTVDQQGKSHVETFSNVPIVIVIHTAADPENSDRCRSEYRAIRQINGQLEPSIIARGGSCMVGTGDQKNYTGLFIW